MEEIAKLDANDESLKKWKESLGVKVGAAAKEGPNVQVLSMTLKAPDREVVIDISSPEKIKEASKKPIVWKDDVDCSVIVRFKVNHDVVIGLQCHRTVTVFGFMSKHTKPQIIGSYAPKTDIQTAEWKELEMPGVGKYPIHSKFKDDDGNTWADFKWELQVKKEWA